MRIQHSIRSASFAVTLALIGGALSVPADAATPTIPEIPGLLPSLQDVPVSEPLPIDGIWTIRELGKRIAIDKGRGWAVDSWLHAFVFRIMPNQVVLRNFQAMPDGTFTADDLPLMSRVRFTPQPDGSLTAQTQGLIPVTYHLDPAGPNYGGGYGGGYGGDYGGGFGGVPGGNPPGGDAGTWPGAGDPSTNPDAGQAPVSPWGS